MTDMYHENGTKVETPDGHIGRIRVTRRERKLLASGLLSIVLVNFNNRPSKRYLADQLEVVNENWCPGCNPDNCPGCDGAMDVTDRETQKENLKIAIYKLDTNEGVKDVLQAMMGLIK